MTETFAKLLVLCLVPGMLAGCDREADPPTPRMPAVVTAAPEPTGPFLTDSTSYTLRPDGEGWSASIGYTYTNSSPDTLYVVNCNEQITMTLEKREGTGWVPFWIQPTNACLSQPMVIAPGTRFSGRLPVWGGEPGVTNSTEFASAELEGEYRLTWHQLALHFDPALPDFGGKPADDLIRSNSFRMARLAPSTP